MIDPRVFLLGLMAISVPWGSSRAQESSSTVVSKTYRIGSDFLREHGGGNAAGPSDPFAAEDPGRREPVQNVQQILAEELGIEFPEGTHARYDPRTGRLEIRHVPGVIKAIEAYFTALNPGEKSLTIRAEIYQVPARVALRLQQFCGPLDEHSAALKSVTAMVERGEGKFVTAAPVLVRSGQRSRVQQVEEVIYPTEVDWDDDGETVVPAAFDTRNVGTVLEVDPVIGADDFSIDLNLSLEHHTAPPTMRPVTVTSPKTGRQVAIEFPEFHSKQVVTSIVMRDGAVKLIGAWRPTGKPEFENADLMQVAFIRADIVTHQTMVPEPGGDSGSN